MSQCGSPTLTAARPSVCLSVHDRGEAEALAYKWIESEKAGRDLGEVAICTWVHAHWNGFLRARWLEHLQGRAFWIELDQGDYGLLQRAFQNSPLLDPILTLLKANWENLPVIVWARENKMPLDEVIEILTSLDINSRRIACQFDRRRSNAS